MNKFHTICSALSWLPVVMQMQHPERSLTNPGSDIFYQNSQANFLNLIELMTKCKNSISEKILLQPCHVCLLMEVSTNYRDGSYYVTLTEEELQMATWTDLGALKIFSSSIQVTKDETLKPTEIEIDEKHPKERTKEEVKNV